MSYADSIHIGKDIDVASKVMSQFTYRFTDDTTVTEHDYPYPRFWDIYPDSDTVMRIIGITSRYVHLTSSGGTVNGITIDSPAVALTKLFIRKGAHAYTSTPDFVWQDTVNSTTAKVELGFKKIDDKFKFVGIEVHANSGNGYTAFSETPDFKETMVFNYNPSGGVNAQVTPMLWIYLETNGANNGIIVVQWQNQKVQVLGTAYDKTETTAEDLVNSMASQSVWECYSSLPLVETALTMKEVASTVEDLIDPLTDNLNAEFNKRFVSR